MYMLRCCGNRCGSTGRQTKGYLGVFLEAGYVQDRGLGFSPEAVPS